MIKPFNTIINKNKNKKDLIYKLLSYHKLELCVDVGAGMGAYTKVISKISKDKSKIYAYEPFKGNFPFLREKVSSLKNVEIVEKALSNEEIVTDFFVHSKVTGKEKNWEEYKGYSSVGFLSSVSKIDCNLYPNGETYKVECSTLDKDFYNKNINFLKVDVQGAEANVLKGASKLLENNLIDIIYLEWSGEKEVIDILNNYNYTIFDSTYLFVPKKDIDSVLKIGFEIIEQVQLSTGKEAYEVVIKNNSISPIDAVNEVKNQQLGYIQTDLIVISKNFNSKFKEIVDKYNQIKDTHE